MAPPQHDPKERKNAFDTSDDDPRVARWQGSSVEAQEELFRSYQVATAKVAALQQRSSVHNDASNVSSQSKQQGSAAPSSMHPDNQQRERKPDDTEPDSRNTMEGEVIDPSPVSDAGRQQHNTEGDITMHEQQTEGPASNAETTPQQHTPQGKSASHNSPMTIRVKHIWTLEQRRVMHQLIVYFSDWSNRKRADVFNEIFDTSLIEEDFKLEWELAHDLDNQTVDQRHRWDWGRILTLVPDRHEAAERERAANIIRVAAGEPRSPIHARFRIDAHPDFWASELNLALLIIHEDFDFVKRDRLRIFNRMYANYISGFGAQRGPLTTGEFDTQYRGITDLFRRSGHAGLQDSDVVEREMMVGAVLLQARALNLQGHSGTVDNIMQPVIALGYNSHGDTETTERTIGGMFLGVKSLEDQQPPPHAHLTSQTTLRKGHRKKWTDEHRLALLQISTQFDLAWKDRAKVFNTVFRSQQKQRGVDPIPLSTLQKHYRERERSQREAWSSVLREPQNAHEKAERQALLKKIQFAVARVFPEEAGIPQGNVSQPRPFPQQQVPTQQPPHSGLTATASGSGASRESDMVRNKRARITLQQPGSDQEISFAQEPEDPQQAFTVQDPALMEDTDSVEQLVPAQQAASGGDSGSIQQPPRVQQPILTHIPPREQFSSSQLAKFHPKPHQNVLPSQNSMSPKTPAPQQLARYQSPHLPPSRRAQSQPFTGLPQQSPPMQPWNPPPPPPSQLLPGQRHYPSPQAQLALGQQWLSTLQQQVAAQQRQNTPGPQQYAPRPPQLPPPAPIDPTPLPPRPRPRSKQSSTPVQPRPVLPPPQPAPLLSSRGSLVPFSTQPPQPAKPVAPFRPLDIPQPSPLLPPRGTLVPFPTPTADQKSASPSPAIPPPPPPPLPPRGQLVPWRAPSHQSDTSQQDTPAAAAESQDEEGDMEIDAEEAVGDSHQQQQLASSRQSTPSAVPESQNSNIDAQQAPSQADAESDDEVS